MLVEPMYYYHDNLEAYEYKNQYYFGGLLVAPILEPTKKGLASANVWLPQGKWTDIFTGDEYEGGREVEVYRTLDSIPVFAKEGQIIVRSLDAGNSTENPQKLLVEIYNGEGTFALYEKTEKGELWTYIRTFNQNNEQKVVVTTVGKDILPKKREIVFEFKNIKNSSEVKVILNDKKHKAEVKQRECLKVEISNFKYAGEYVITANYIPQEKIDYVKQRAYKIIMTMQGENKIRNELYEKIKKAKTLTQIEKEVNSASIDLTYKKYLLSF